MLITQANPGGKATSQTNVVSSTNLTFVPYQKPTLYTPANNRQFINDPQEAPSIFASNPPRTPSPIVDPDAVCIEGTDAYGNILKPQISPQINVDRFALLFVEVLYIRVDTDTL